MFPFTRAILFTSQRSTSLLAVGRAHTIIYKPTWKIVSKETSINCFAEIKEFFLREFQFLLK